MSRLLAVFLFVLGFYAAWPAHAQDAVTCESQDGKYRECQAFNGRATLDRSLSDAPCVEGRTWGNRNGVVWVDRGCRGRFVPSRARERREGNASNTIRCESSDSRTRECAANFRGRAVLTRQLSESRCVEGRSWGQRGDNIWVSHGCRGEFAEERGDDRHSDGPRGGDRHSDGRRGGDRQSDGPRGGNRDETVTCDSSDNRRHSCDWDSRNGRPVLIRKLSDSACVEGRTWAYRDGQIWVDEGCRAEFGAR